MSRNKEGFVIERFVKNEKRPVNPIQRALQEGIGVLSAAMAHKQTTPDQLSEEEIARGITFATVSEEPHRLVWETRAIFPDQSPEDSEMAAIKFGVENSVMRITFSIGPNDITDAPKSLVTEQNVLFTWEKSGEISVGGKNVNPIDYALHMKRITKHVRESIGTQNATVRVYPGNNFNK